MVRLTGLLAALTLAAIPLALDAHPAMLMGAMLAGLAAASAVWWARPGLAAAAATMGVVMFGAALPGAMSAVSLALAVGLGVAILVVLDLAQFRRTALQGDVAAEVVRRHTAALATAALLGLVAAVLLALLAESGARLLPWAWRTPVAALGGILVLAGLLRAGTARRGKDAG